MIIKNFGLFWRADEVDWYPGKGARFRLLGRIGVNRPGVRLADFRDQQGIYILYSNHGPYYVGLTKKQGLAKRLRDHLEDKHSERWDRFSWFGFQTTNDDVDDDGVFKVVDLEEQATVDTQAVITDIEALLIHAIGPRNVNTMNFAEAEEWVQVKLDEIDKYMEKVAV
ncbi:GIY-YIG nuclease family protein [Telmatospirillum sp.]|uniref:GIY-YIG nuclease family protein n=1 Tax=Telmatospirillum sp. TaxID=2079197 RepID=UPI002849DEC1|nr:GIY-YIG nuclease family protein [Telmatospirillum sp.]MDR3435594.1 GIY-YIG nuclease family protein [Telmatospirillum sp.]